MTISVIKTEIVRNAALVDGYKAFIPNTGYTGVGKSIASAIGDLVFSHPEKFGAKIDLTTLRAHEIYKLEPRA
jgi:hypothetical protein